MIDVSTQIYSDLTKLLREDFPDIYTARCKANVTPRFPAVSIVEQNNITYAQTIERSNETYVKLTYYFEIFANDSEIKQQQAEKIRDIINKQMIDWGFIRTLCQPLPNLEDLTIYRINMRYEAVVSREGYVYTK